VCIVLARDGDAQERVRHRVAEVARGSEGCRGHKRSSCRVGLWFRAADRWGRLARVVTGWREDQDSEPDRDQRAERQYPGGGLSVFSGGCSLPAPEAVCDADLDTLHALIDRSLLRMDGDRYRMLQTLREYALEKLAQAGETSSHTQWFVDMVDSEALNLYASPVDPTLLVAERENFRSALEWASDINDTETVARLGSPRRWRGRCGFERGPQRSPALVACRGRTSRPVSAVRAGARSQRGTPAGKKARRI
jgi:hypothetical protein